MGERVAGRFELLDPIASGGMGEVWTARDHRDGTLVAVKLLRQSDAGSLLRFVREQRVRIDHPHVLTPLAWAAVDDRVLFSMPLVDGGSVAGLVGDYGPLPARYAAELLRQLLRGLDAVHRAGIIHRDIKPANLLLDAVGTGRPRLRLSDFGVALQQDAPRLTTTAQVIGTRGYLAPEQQRWAQPSPAQDLYAVGIVGRELLTAVPAAPASTPRPDGVDSELWRLLDRLTEIDPTARPTLHAALAALDAPELAWVEQDEIDVFAQLGLDATAAPATSVAPAPSDTGRPARTGALTFAPTPRARGNFPAPDAARAR